MESMFLVRFKLQLLLAFKIVSDCIIFHMWLYIDVKISEVCFQELGTLREVSLWVHTTNQIYNTINRTVYSAGNLDDWQQWMLHDIGKVSSRNFPLAYQRFSSEHTRFCSLFVFPGTLSRILFTDVLFQYL